MEGGLRGSSLLRSCSVILRCVNIRAHLITEQNSAEQTLACSVAAGYVPVLISICLVRVHRGIVGTSGMYGQMQYSCDHAGFYFSTHSSQSLEGTADGQVRLTSVAPTVQELLQSDGEQGGACEAQKSMKESGS